MDQYQEVVKYVQVNVNEFSQLSFNMLENRDIIPGVYEGGLTLWECTLDLLKFIQNIDFTDKRVIDVGCGYGLLGIKALKQQAAHVTFQDYNSETSLVVEKQLQVNNVTSKNYDFIHGDWVKLKIADRYDIALASEVIYREENYEKITQFLCNILKDNGVCYMINKAYYFGVGGSVEGYKEYLEKDGRLRVVEEVVLNNKKSNKKVIMRLQQNI